METTTKAARHTSVLVLGAGPAGLTAAIYAARANLAPLLVQGLQPGGQLTITSDVENYPGFAEPVMGPWLMEQMTKQAESCGVGLVSDVVTAIDLSTRPFRVTGDGGETYTGDTLIVATGAQARWLGLESEYKFGGAGVSACATCDGFFFRGKPVAVVGGGNTAAEEALYLAKMCERVTLIHRRDRLRADKVLQDRIANNPKIEILWDHAVDEVLGTDEPKAMTGLRLRHVRSGETRELAVDGLFVAIGHNPATDLFAGQLEMDSEGYIVTAPDSTRTSRPGVFAAGDVQDRIFRQAVTAAGTGCMAALEAERFLTEQATEEAA